MQPATDNDVTLYIDYDGGPYPFLERLAKRGTPVRRFVERLSLDSASRRNPRNQEYMRKLAAEQPAADSSSWLTVHDPGALDRQRLASARRIVLLWRDANGTGWTRIERAIFERKAPDARVMVLNGRRRQFELTPADWRGHKFRRAVEKSLIPEAALAATLVAVGTALVGWDVIRGKNRHGR